MLRSLLLSLSLLQSVLLSAGCSSDRPLEPGPGSLPPLTPAVWQVHTADGAVLPALVAHQLLNGSVLEQTFLDSATIEIRADGTWIQRTWLQVYRGGAWYQNRARQELGTIVATSTGYRFVSDPYGLRFTLAPITADSVVANLRTDAIERVFVSTLRLSAPLRAPVGDWRANAVRNLPLPTVVYAFDSEEVDGRLVSVHLVADSAGLRLLPTGRYEHWISYSEWLGPVGGGPTERRFRWRWSDHGIWHQSGLMVSFESNYYQNHRMTGEFAVAGPLRVDHGLGHNEPLAAFRYSLAPKR